MTSLEWTIVHGYPSLKTVGLGCITWGPLRRQFLVVRWLEQIIRAGCC